MLLPIAFFAVAALGGVIMAVKVLGGSPPPWVLSILHAALGAAGIVTLLLAIAGSDLGTTAWVVLGIFVVVALGGFYLVSFHARGIPHPRPVIVIHALAAVVAFVLLLAVAAGLV